MKSSVLKKVIALVMALALVFTLFACTQTSDGNTNTSKETEANSESKEETAANEGTSERQIVNLYIPAGNIAEANIELFNKSQDKYEVVPTVINGDDYDDKIKVLAAGGSDVVDVVWIRTPAQMNQYIKNDYFYDLQASAKEYNVDLSKIEGQIAAVSGENGAFYGYPDKGTCWMLFYNKELFDKKGLEYPDNLTWDQYLDLIKTLTYEEDGTKYYGGLNPNWTPNLGAIAAGEYLDDEDLEYTKKYCEVMHRMYCEDKSAPGVEEMALGTFDVNAYFASGNYYTMINGDWDYNLLECDFEFGTSPLPIFPDMDPETSVGQASFFAVPKTAKCPEGGAAFAAFYCTSDAGTAEIAKTKNVPAYSTDAAMKAYQESVDVPGLNYRFSSTIINEQKADVWYGDVLADFTSEQQLYLLDELTLDEMIEEFKKLREEDMTE